MARIVINGERLDKAVHALGYTLSAASIKISKSSNYLSNCKARGTIDETAARLLASDVGVPIELYEAPEKPAAPATDPEPVQLTIDQPAAVFYEILDELKAIRQELNVLIDYQDDRAKENPDDWPVF